MVLEGAMPPVLAFFFFTTGAGTHAGVLLRTWPMAIVLFLVPRPASARSPCHRPSRPSLAPLPGAPRLCADRLPARLRDGQSRQRPASSPLERVACIHYPGPPPPARAPPPQPAHPPPPLSAWQAGLSLGLADEIAHQYAGWGPRLEAILVSVIVLNQIIGPPLLERSIRSAGEDNAGKISAKAAEMAIERSPLRRATLTSVSSADDLSGTELPGGVVVDAASSSPRT